MDPLSVRSSRELLGPCWWDFGVLGADSLDYFWEWPGIGRRVPLGCMCYTDTGCGRASVVCRVNFRQFGAATVPSNRGTFCSFYSLRPDLFFRLYDIF